MAVLHFADESTMNDKALPPVKIERLLGYLKEHSLAANLAAAELARGSDDRAGFRHAVISKRLQELKAAYDLRADQQD